MANRRISEFPSIPGVGIDEQDLLPLVHVFEVDPVLRNKKITFTEFKNYLDLYYVRGDVSTFSGNVVIHDDLTVSGTSNFTSITGLNLATFSGVVVQNNLTATGTISGITITGNTIEGLSGVFQDLFAVNQTFGGNLTFSGDTSTLGSGTIASGLTVSGTLSGTTITGTTVLAPTGSFASLTGTTTTGVTAQFTTGTFSSITGATLAITTPSGVTPAIVCSGVVSGGTSGFVIHGPLIILP